ncbi:MAG: histidine kinase, partial [Colwellia sp.]|nr:histidine kinase [Colwellia sp.]
GNAVKFTESGSVEVSAEEQEGRLQVRVEDTGIGIAEAQQERIFVAFEQADASVEREYGGTGLGLAVSRRLVELHGGTIDLESAPGVGSTFSFSLPLAAGVPAAEVPAGTAPAGEIAASQHPVASHPMVARHVSLASLREGVSSASLRQDIDPPAAEDALTAGVAPAGSPRFLIVDDEPVNLQVLENYLSL